MSDIRFAAYPSAVVYKNPDGTKPVQHLLWGDWLRLKAGRAGDYVEVRARGEDGWIHKDGVQTERLLEVVFVDIGQGDGCLVVTPADEHMVVDAGVGDNMFRFLRWRYGGFAAPFPFEAAVISHPDQDHYGGFDRIFDEPNVTFGTLYHNGIVERTGTHGLGARTAGRPSYLTELVRTEAELAAFLSVPARWNRKKYPTMLNKGFDAGRFAAFRMLAAADGFLPGYEADKELSFQVLGPVTEPDGNGAPRLRWLSNAGKTKNGHSVVLRARYRNVRILLGGDLNIPSQKLLLSHHTGLSTPPRTREQYDTLVEAARQVFQVDIAKTCHHGSHDFMPAFLHALHPIASVISSGDDEPHSHPRADALGALGVHSRGVRPLIFSTELARSAREAIKHPYVLRSRIAELQKAIAAAPTGTAAERRRKARLEKEFQTLIDSIDRSIAVYGAINVRTDGHRVVIAQKLERPRRKDAKWDIYRLEPEGNGPLRFQASH